MVGLVAGTLAGGLAHDLRQLTMARVIAGAFGGPATSIAYAIIADVIPTERRGKAMGAVMGAFSVAQVLGVPAALIVSEHFGWRMPFYGAAVLGGVVALAERSGSCRRSPAIASAAPTSPSPPSANCCHARRCCCRTR